MTNSTSAIVPSAVAKLIGPSVGPFSERGELSEAVANPLVLPDMIEPGDFIDNAGAITAMLLGGRDDSLSRIAQFRLGDLRREMNTYPLKVIEGNGGITCTWFGAAVPPPGTEYLPSRLELEKMKVDFRPFPSLKLDLWKRDFDEVMQKSGLAEAFEDPGAAAVAQAMRDWLGVGQNGPKTFNKICFSTEKNHLDDIVSVFTMVLDAEKTEGHGPGERIANLLCNAARIMATGGDVGHWGNFELQIPVDGGVSTVHGQVIGNQLIMTMDAGNSVAEALAEQVKDALGEEIPLPEISISQKTSRDETTSTITIDFGERTEKENVNPRLLAAVAFAAELHRMARTGSASVAAAETVTGQPTEKELKNLAKALGLREITWNADERIVKLVDIFSYADTATAYLETWSPLNFLRELSRERSELSRFLDDTAVSRKDDFNNQRAINRRLQALAKFAGYELVIQPNGLRGGGPSVIVKQGDEKIGTIGLTESAIEPLQQLREFLREFTEILDREEGCANGLR